MEGREFIRLLNREKKLFFIIFAVIVGGALAWFGMRERQYDVVVSLHIARTSQSVLETKEYQYGDFYRLQADEKFADTVVRWLLSPRTVLDILKDSHVSEERYNDLTGKFRPKRLSSQFIEVRFSVRTEDEGERIVESMRSVLNAQAQHLNIGSSPQEGWFVVVVDKPVISLSVFDWKKIIFFSSIAGALLGVWGVLMKRYFGESEEG